MNKKQELEFLKAITLGLLNKKGVSFTLTSRPYGNTGENALHLLIVNGDSTTNGNVIRLNISYITSSPSVDINIDYRGNERRGLVTIYTRADAIEYLKTLLKTVKSESPDYFSRYNDKIDYYGVINKISDELFSSKDKFEFSAWRKTIYLKDALAPKFPQYTIGYDTLTEEHHVHGGVGNVPTLGDLHDITTRVEMAVLPQTGVNYLGVVKNIVKSPLVPLGLYENHTAKAFEAVVVEQFKGAWNKS